MMPKAVIATKSQVAAWYRESRSPASSIHLLIARHLAPEPLDTRAEPLALEPSGLLASRHPGRLPRLARLERRREQREKPLFHRLAIPELAPASRLHQPEPTLAIEPADQSLAQDGTLCLAGRGAFLEIPPKLDPGRGGVDVLAAGPARAGGAEAHFGPGNPKIGAR